MLLKYDKGTISIKGEYNLPYTKWDERTDNLRAMAYRYRDIKDYLDKSGIEYEDRVLDPIPTSDLNFNVELRPYQKEAISRWMDLTRGVIVLPTGSGKTYVGIAAICNVNSPCFIVVPTLDLVDQWIDVLKKHQLPAGEYTGRKKQTKPITVSTYDSAYIHAEKLGNKYKMILFDEVHHLPSEGYRHIAEFFASPHRMGLTATYEREDSLHRDLSDLLGGKVYEVDTDELTGEYLSDYRTEIIRVELTDQEFEKYDEYTSIFRNYLRSTNIQMKGPSDFKKIVMRSGNDPRAWKAVRAKNNARQIAYSSEAKIKELAKLLKKHIGDRIIIFTRYNNMVYRISRKFLIPAITHETDKTERESILRKFKDNTYQAIVSSKVLDEGVDVPDANVGIILSGTGSKREYRQRLGRLLRPSGNDTILYEVVTKNTTELRTSSRRKRE
ncbi:ssDNA-dependent ATPase helicase superfamily II XpB [Methanonatronarchaeum thermophilum]|uniref:DNA 3'-5' helicase n=1 Tax=Methanonatronarchaeum thermophilum TaxID=1927129 RepID=A0A1Y3GCQ3_9EURY|nr:DEAD/DEAH box helicase family protein [Methanonatronarchaeum thermophilum]OUJ19020.1 ssDNA-dependent ATPase helicase superfamily II XpB [Methanonatronarchaeum thermophilum]